MIEDIILRHSQRGMDVLRPYMPKAFCEEAVEALLNLPHGVIFLTTGFYVGFEKIRISARDRNRCFVQGLF